MPSEKILTAKQAYVAELKEKIANSVAGVVVDYKGINVADDTKLRKELREAGVEYFVVKNTCLLYTSRALRGARFKRAQKNRGAGHGAPGNDSVHWSALSFPGFQTFKQKLFHVHRAFYLEILLCRLCSFTSPAHQLGANDVTTLGYPSLGF